MVLLGEKTGVTGSAVFFLLVAGYVSLVLVREARARNPQIPKHIKWNTHMTV